MYIYIYVQAKVEELMCQLAKLKKSRSHEQASFQAAEATMEVSSKVSLALCLGSIVSVAVNPPPR